MPLDNLQPKTDKRWTTFGTRMSRKTTTKRQQERQRQQSSVFPFVFHFWISVCVCVLLCTTIAYCGSITLVHLVHRSPIFTQYTIFYHLNEIHLAPFQHNHNHTNIAHLFQWHSIRWRVCFFSHCALKSIVVETCHSICFSWLHNSFRLFR